MNGRGNTAGREPGMPDLLAGERTLRAQLRQRWRAMAPRERRLVTAMLVAVGVLLVWLIAVRPAWRVARDSPAQLAQVEAQLQQMQRLADEARGLRGAAPVALSQAAASLRSATERLGAGARLSLQGDRATVTLTDVPSDALHAWLAEARSAARARPVELQLVRGANGFSGSVVLVLAGGAGAGS